MVLVDGIGPKPKLKATTEYRKPGFCLSLVRNLALILLFSALVFISINLPAYFLIYRYKVDPNSFAIEPPKVALVPSEIKQYSDNTLFIPKIGVKAPIGWNIESSKVMEELQNYLAHISGSVLPGEKGNVFITGHSSNYWWKEGDYNTVFALLPELSEGDEIYLIYKGQIYKYKVSEKIEVKKNEINDHFASDEEELTLMTCVPVGTNLKRLLVVAKPTQ